MSSTFQNVNVLCVGVHSEFLPNMGNSKVLAQGYQTVLTHFRLHEAIGTLDVLCNKVGIWW